MRFREFRPDENWPSDLVLVRVMADGAAYVAEPSPKIPENPLPVPAALNYAQSLLGYREVAVRLEAGAVWDNAWGELDRVSP